MKPMIVNGKRVIQVRSTTAAERRMVDSRPFAAMLLGWHRWECPSYGDTAQQAVATEAKRRGLSLDAVAVENV